MAGHTTWNGMADESLDHPGRRHQSVQIDAGFDVHVVETRDGYILIEEGDYGELPMHLIDQIVYTATGKMADEF